MQTESRSCLSIILAAGKGTRMRTALPKVLHPVAHLPMVGHVMRAASGQGSTATAVVVGHGAEQVEAFVRSVDQDTRTFRQSEQLGTAHAVLAARSAIAQGFDDVLVLFGDTPLLTSDTLTTARGALSNDTAVAVVGFETREPTGYGRLLIDNGKLVAIREERDASEAERSITLCNGGIMAIAGEHALELLDAVGNDNAKGEYYLTDIVEIARERSLGAVAVVAPETDVMGVNTLVELADAEAIWQQRRRRELMLSGVSMTDPSNVHLAFDTVIEAGARIDPYVVFGSGSTVRSGAHVLAHSHIEGATIGENATVGPFAHLRPGANLGSDSKVGNFCEVKKANIAPGAKVNHLTYIGDATVGANANIGAGTITCNYDGVNKHLTEIGADAFIGSNSALVAPVSIGDGAYVASGSVVTKDVPSDGLAFARARQSVREGHASKLRERALAAKAAREAAE